MISSLFKCLDRQINSQRKAEESGEGSRSWLKGWQSALELGFPDFSGSSSELGTSQCVTRIWSEYLLFICSGLGVNIDRAPGGGSLDDLCLLSVPELSRAEQLLGSEVQWSQRGTELSYSGILSFPQQLRRWAESSGGEAWRAQSAEVSPHPKFSLATSISDNNAYKLKIPKDF